MGQTQGTTKFASREVRICRTHSKGDAVFSPHLWHEEGTMNIRPKPVLHWFLHLILKPLYRIVAKSSIMIKPESKSEWHGCPLGEIMARQRQAYQSMRRSYLRAITQTLWNYADQHHVGELDCGEGHERPPVLAKRFASKNVLIPPDSVRAQVIRTAIPTNKRHRWFHSLKKLFEKSPVSAIWLQYGFRKGMKSLICTSKFAPLVPL